MPHIGSVKLEKLSGATINALYAKLAQSGKTNGRSGLSPLSIRHVHAVLHRALKDAVGGVGSSATPSTPPTHRE